jgi:hypothetical protein
LRLKNAAARGEICFLRVLRHIYFLMSSAIIAMIVPASPVKTSISGTMTFAIHHSIFSRRFVLASLLILVFPTSLMPQCSLPFSS